MSKKEINVTIIGYTKDEGMEDLTIFYMEGVNGQKYARSDRLQEELIRIFTNAREERTLLDICGIPYISSEEEQLDIFTGNMKKVPVIRFEGGKIAYFKEDMVKFTISKDFTKEIILEEVPRGFLFGQSWKRTLVFQD